MRLLVLEDEVPQRESLKLLLETAGYTVYAAAAVEGAKALLEAHPPDAVILDLLVPGSGLSFLRWLREREELKAASRLPVVVTTGLPQEKVVGLEGLEPTRLLIKPYALEQLLAAVTSMQGG